FPVLHYSCLLRPCSRLRASLFPYTTLFRSRDQHLSGHGGAPSDRWIVLGAVRVPWRHDIGHRAGASSDTGTAHPTSGRISSHIGDRKSTRLNSSHVSNSYAVVCLKKKRAAQ